MSSLVGEREMSALWVGSVWIVLFPAACVQAGDPDSKWPAVRDSAGIAIVENGGEPPAVWRLSPRPGVSVSDEDRPIEEIALDPVSVFAQSSGAIVVGDGHNAGWQAVMRYDAKGAFLDRAGGRGSGPGEFGGQLWWASLYRGDSIVAWDLRGPAGPSIKVFDPVGSYARDVPIPRPSRTPAPGTTLFGAGVWGSFDDGDFLTTSDGIVTVPSRAGPTTYSHLALSVDPAGITWDTIGEFDLAETYWNGTAPQSYRFGRPGLLRAYRGDLLVANARDYEYRIVDRRNRLRRIVRMHQSTQPVRAEDRRAADEKTLRLLEGRVGITREAVARAALKLKRTPTAPYKPAYSSVLVDPNGSVWVERYRWMDRLDVPVGPEASLWDVFDPSGAWTATLEAPPGVLILSVGARSAFGVSIDDTGVRRVVVYDVTEHPTS